MEIYGVRHDRGADNGHGRRDAARPVQARSEQTGCDSGPVRRRDHELDQVTHNDYADKASDQDFDWPETRALQAQRRIAAIATKSMLASKGMPHSNVSPRLAPRSSAISVAIAATSLANHIV
jgi:hypothetical protein